MRKTSLLLFGGILTACSTTGPAPDASAPASEAAAQATAAVEKPLPKTLQEAVAPTFRNPQNMLRDGHRHPLETLKFFGVKPDMTVVEISPGAGWYTEILAPYLSGQGRYVAAVVPSEAGEYFKKSNDALNGWGRSNPNVKLEFGNFAPPQTVEFIKPGTADMVLTFRNVHNWMNKEGGVEKAFASFYAALKPGGVLGVVEHRQSEKSKADHKSGYVKESQVIALATKAGFKLESRSEVNANPRDTKDHPEGVWTLPPTLALKDKDKAKYLAIGESDRMTLRFIKPKK